MPYLDLNLGTIAAVLYSALYLLLEPVAGLTLGGICIAAAAGGNYLRALDPDNTLVSATAAHIVCWLIQLVGNSFSSSKTGRSPALLENLVRTLFLSPMYVWLKVLFALGYRPELQARVRAKVQAELQKTKPKSK